VTDSHLGDHERTLAADVVSHLRREVHQLDSARASLPWKQGTWSWSHQQRTWTVVVRVRRGSSRVIHSEVVRLDQVEASDRRQFTTGVVAGVRAVELVQQLVVGNEPQYTAGGTTAQRSSSGMLASSNFCAAA
jgi:hypothetical protein